MKALVTGASRGIGKHIVRELNSRGWFVLGIARGGEELEKLRRELGDRFEYVIADLAKPNEVTRVIDYVKTRFDKIDLLVNNAGAGLYKPVLQHNVEDIIDLTMLNMVSPIILTKELFHIMGKNSTIVFVITAAIHVAFSKLPLYGASKLALHYVVKILRRELGEKGINVIAVYPGYIKTDFHERAGYKGVDRGASPEAVAKAIVEAVEKRKREVYFPRYMKMLKIIGPYLPLI